MKSRILETLRTVSTNNDANDPKQIVTILLLNMITKLKITPSRFAIIMMAVQTLDFLKITFHSIFLSIPVQSRD